MYRLITTNSVRFRKAAGDDKILLEFGLRRAQGPDGGMSASRYSYIGGFDGTSNLEAGMRYNIPVRGTHAHSFVLSYTCLDDLKVLKYSFFSFIYLFIYFMFYSVKCLKALIW